MRVVPMFRVSALEPLLHFVNQSANVHPLRVFGESLAALEDPNALIPLSLGGRAFECAAKALGMPDLGVQLGERTSVEQIGEFGALARASQTLGSALELTVRSGSRFNTGQAFWLERRGGEVRLHRKVSRALDRGRRPANDFALMIVLQLIRLAAGPRWRPNEIHFEGPPPEHAERLADLAEKCARFENPQTTIVFQERLLALPMPRWQATRRATGLAMPSPDPVASLRQAIDSLLRTSRIDVRDAASAAGLSVRSLQRRLAAAGLSFSLLLEQERFQAARRRLVEPGATVIDVAAGLGYSDAANFTRAFRRWAGISPSEFRRAAAETS